MPDRKADAGTVWSRVEDGFHVASRDGNFLGYIDRQRDGRYLAFNMRSEAIGQFADLVAAMRAVAAAPALSQAAAGIFTIRETR